MLSKYFWNILVAIDQLINTLFGGDPDETISSRIGKWALLGSINRGTKKYIYKLLNPLVNLFQKDHFAKSIEQDEGKNEILK